MPNFLIYLIIAAIALSVVAATIVAAKIRRRKKYERGLKMVPLLIHLPPMTDDVGGSESGKSGRDQRDIAEEAISKAQVMYSILASTVKKGLKAKIYGQRHFSLEIIARDGFIRYYAVVPAVLTETVCQAIQSAYPTARVEEKREENIFKHGGGLQAVAGAELSLTKDGFYPIATYEDTKRDGQMALLNALSTVKAGEGAAVQILFRPAQKNWSNKAKKYMADVQQGKNTNGFAGAVGNLALDLIRAPWEPPEAHEKDDRDPVTNLKQTEIEAIAKKVRYPAFETLVRVIASSDNQPRSEAIVGGIVSAFSQFNTPELNGFKVDLYNASKKLVVDYTLRFFDAGNRHNILNSVELATIYHLPEQNAIPNSQVERQLAKQVDGPAKIPEDGLLLGVNEFRGVKKPIYLAQNDRRRHMYVIGQTGMGKSVFLENLAFQDMCDGRGFAFIDPHGDAVEAILKRVPEERMDDVIYFDPADIEHPIGMNMFEFTDPDQKDFIVQEGISMLQSLFDPNNQGFFGARGQHMFRNAALLLMSDPAGATFIDIPQCFTDPEFVKSKLKYVTDKAVYDYWTKEFPQSQKSNDAGEVTTWFASKWGPFLANTIMRNTLGQVKSGFNIREIMDTNKIFLVNLSKGRLGDVNANLLGMIFVMKFQQAAMSRQDIPEEERKDFCLYVDEFQNFATDSFESILSEARKYRLNLIVANQFMTQLTDKIREALLGNVGSIICGRVGVTDADLMVKAFTPVFTAEDLTKTPNHAAIAKVMMYDMPASPFTMNLPAPMGEPNDELMESLKLYSATKYSKTREEVEKEINERWNAVDKAKKEASGKGKDDSDGGSVKPLSPSSSHSASGGGYGASGSSSTSGSHGASGNASSASTGPSRASKRPSFIDRFTASNARAAASTSVPSVSAPPPTSGASIRAFDLPTRTKRGGAPDGTFEATANHHGVPHNRPYSGASPNNFPNNSHESLPNSAPNSSPNFSPNRSPLGEPMIGETYGKRPYGEQYSDQPQPSSNQPQSLADQNQSLENYDDDTNSPSDASVATQKSPQNASYPAQNSPSEASDGTSDAFSGQKRLTNHPETKDASNRSRKPRNGYLNSWLDKPSTPELQSVPEPQPAPEPQSASQPTSEPSSDTSDTSASRLSVAEPQSSSSEPLPEPSAPTPVLQVPVSMVAQLPTTPNNATNYVQAPTLAPTPVSTPVSDVISTSTPTSTSNPTSTSTSVTTSNIASVTSSTPDTTSITTPTPVTEPEDTDEDDTDAAPPPPEPEGISLQSTPEADSTPEDEVVFRIR